ncbi:hypothetical protein O4160_22040 [Rhodococcus sp. IEGM 1401]|nr:MULTISPECIES: hypothetical protein [Nocardiaceae]MCZ4563525.1 hypothetical protein [Rhodococcus sp. IEGM 1401]MDI9923660.1 hypothetical protein [Rhodococcus sp. IEGM 1372]
MCSPWEPVVYDRLTCDEHFELFGRAYRAANGGAATLWADHHG